MQVQLLPQLSTDGERRFSIVVDGSLCGYVVLTLHPASGTGTVAIVAETSTDIPGGVAAIALQQASELARRMGIAIADGDSQAATPAAAR